MTDTAQEPTTAQLQSQLADMQQQLLNQRIESARLAVYAAHPHLREMQLLESFQGGPDEIRAFGETLAQRIPPPAPTPAPLTQAPQPQQPVAVPPQAVTTPQPAPETSALPTPGPQDVLPQQSADVARANDIRDRMTQGLATRQEVQWLAQWAPRREVDLGNGLMGTSGGFVSAAKGLNRG